MKVDPKGLLLLTLKGCSLWNKINKQLQFDTTLVFENIRPDLFKGKISSMKECFTIEEAINAHYSFEELGNFPFVLESCYYLGILFLITSQTYACVRFEFQDDDVCILGVPPVLVHFDMNPTNLLWDPDFSKVRSGASNDEYP